MLRLRFPANALQKRLIRPHYAQTQATPYAAVLHSSIGSGQAFTKPLAADTTPFARSADAFTLKSGLVPGTVMVRVSADTVAVGTGTASSVTGGTTKEQPFGLLANFIGGDFDELGTENTVGVWRGPDSVFELLAPAFDPAITAAVLAGAVSGAPVPLVCKADGRLGLPASQSSPVQVVVAHLIDVPSAARIVVDLRI